jgi:hypothetical protein
MSSLKNSKDKQTIKKTEKQEIARKDSGCRKQMATLNLQGLGASNYG